MPTEYKVKTLFEGPRTGWSENHVFVSSVTDPGGLASVIDQITNLRAQMLGREYYIVGYTIRKFKDVLGNKVKHKAFPRTKLFRPTLQSVANTGDPNFVAAKCTSTDTTGDLSARFPLGGVPDVCTANAGGFIPSAGTVDFQGNFDKWVQACIGTNQVPGAGMAFYTLPIIGTGEIINYTINTDSTITYTTNPSQIPGDAVGKVLSVSIAGLNNRRSILNRVQKVIVLSQSTMKTTTARAAFPFSSSGRFNLYGAVPSAVLIAGIQLADVVMRHKRGRPSSVSPGRNKALVPG